MTSVWSEVLRPERARLFGAVVLAIAASLLELAPQALVYVAACAVFADVGPWAGAGLGALGGWALVVLGLTLLRFLLMGGSLVLSHLASFRMAKHLRIRMARSLAEADMRFFAHHSSGDLKKALLDDAASIGGIVEHQLPDLASAIFVPLISLGVLFTVDWRLGLASLALLPLGVVLMALVMRNMGPEFEAWHATEKRAAAAILEFLTGIVVLKSFDRDVASLGDLRDAVNGVRDHAVRITRRTILGYTGFFVLFASNLVVVLPVALFFFREGMVPLETAVLFVALGTGLTAPLLKLLFLFGTLQMNALRIQRVEDVLNAPRARDVCGEAALPEGGTLELRDASFRYEEEGPLALDGVDLTLAPGEIVAVVGPSGAGKSTLARALVGGWPLSRGSLRYGGVALDALAPDARTKLLAYVGQETFLVRGTVRENVAFGRPDAPDDEVRAALEAAGARELVDAMPEGLETELGTGARGLSGGERQRLAIARAALHDAPVRVLDEATAHLDPESERAVQEGLSRLMRGRSTLVIAHRLRTVEGADRIVVLDGGRVVAEGRHEALLESCPTYRTLHEAQEKTARWTLGAPAVPAPAREAAR